MPAETIYVGGRRVTVVRPRPFAATARTMAARGMSLPRICAALCISREGLEAALDAPCGGFWGEFAGVLAAELREQSLEDRRAA